MSESLQQVKRNPNPTGKGGFKDNPQNINPKGAPKKESRVSWWIEKFLDMDQLEFESWEHAGHPMAAKIAYGRVYKAYDELPEAREVMDRTEGKPQQKMDLTTNGQDIKPLLPINTTVE